MEGYFYISFIYFLLFLFLMFYRISLVIEEEEINYSFLKYFLIYSFIISLIPGFRMVYLIANCIDIVDILEE